MMSLVSRRSPYPPALTSTALFLACFLFLAACSTAQTKSALDKAALEAYVRNQQALGPQVKVEISDPRPSPVAALKEVTVRLSSGNASQEETFYISSDGRQFLRGRMFDIGVDPFAANRAKLKLDRGSSLGPATAPITLAVFSDFQCSYCSQEAKSLRENLPKSYPNEVRMVFKDMPLDAIHPWARLAAIAGRCVARQNPAAFWDYHDWVFGAQQRITPENFMANFLPFAEVKGLEVMQLTRCIETRATEQEVAESVAEARELGINSTPTVFVNGRMLAGSVPWQYLQQVIDFELSKPRDAKANDPNCCSVEIPLPGAQKP